MVTELLVRLKTLIGEVTELIRLAVGAAKWETVVRISPERAKSLAEVCAAARPLLDELSGLLADVEKRAREEVEKMK
jgi:hypothetical protein